VAAWKCFLPPIERNSVAAIYAATVQTLSPPGAVACATVQPEAVCQLYPDILGLAQVEPELAFELAEDLPPRESDYEVHEIDAAIGKTRLALELIQCRYAEPGQARFLDLLADSLFNQGLWLGPELNATGSADLSYFELRIDFADGHFETRQARHPNINPRAGLYWLVNFLSQQGIGMRRGQQIITGSYAGVLKLPMHEPVMLTYGDLGQFRVRFEPRTSFEP
jgi:2-keto-4-pentenoate hydratase